MSVRKPFTYLTFASENIGAIYIRPTIIAVEAGIPKGITGFEDLLTDGVKIIVTEGAGVSNNSGTGTWENVPSTGTTVGFCRLPPQHHNLWQGFRRQLQGVLIDGR